MVPAEMSYTRLSEKAFQAQIIQLAHLCGWMVFHPFDSRRSEPGFPDLALVHETRGDFLMAELKTQSGRLSPAQARWIAALRKASIEVHIWRPSDIDSIVTRLSTPYLHSML